MKLLRNSKSIASKNSSKIAENQQKVVIISTHQKLTTPKRIVAPEHLRTRLLQQRHPDLVALSAHLRELQRRPQLLITLPPVVARQPIINYDFLLFLRLRVPKVECVLRVSPQLAVGKHSIF